MKKLLVLASIATLAFGSCREKKTETKEVIREVKVETPEPEEREGILERAGKKVDERVNEEINEELDKIEDDN